jgi:hypothetical protein
MPSLAIGEANRVQGITTRTRSDASISMRRGGRASSYRGGDQGVSSRFHNGIGVAPVHFFPKCDDVRVKRFIPNRKVGRHFRFSYQVYSGIFEQHIKETRWYQEAYWSSFFLAAIVVFGPRRRYSILKLHTTRGEVTRRISSAGND